MSADGKTTSVIIAGLGGQGIVKASDILASAAHGAGYDVKKSEIHGMSQRGGSVSSDVRFGARVLSPMTPRGGADYLAVTEPTQAAPNRHMLRPGGVLITPDAVPHTAGGGEDSTDLMANRTINVALLGVLAAHLPIAEEHWLAAIRQNLPEKLHDLNCNVFLRGLAIERFMGRLSGGG